MTSIHDVIASKVFKQYKGFDEANHCRPTSGIRATYQRFSKEEGGQVQNP